MLLFIYICSVVMASCICLWVYKEKEEVNLVEAICYLLLTILPLVNTLLSVSTMFVLILDKLSKVKIKEKKTE